MPIPDDLVASVRELARTVRLDEAEAVLLGWWSSIDHEELVACEAELRRVIAESFLKKRRTRIIEQLDLALRGPVIAVDAPPHAAPFQRAAASPADVARASFAPQRAIQDEPLPATSRTDACAQPNALRTVIELNRKANPRDAEEAFRRWLADADDTEVVVAESDARAALNEFLKKRHNALTHEYDVRLAKIRAASRTKMGSPTAIDQVAPPVDAGSGRVPIRPSPTARSGHRPGHPGPSNRDYWNYISQRLETRLAELSDRHIFQWNTHYRDTITEFFDPLMDFVDDDGPGAPAASQVAALVGDRFRRHAKEIFYKGWQHARTQSDALNAQTKAENGLQRFLDLPLEVYSARLSSLQDGVSARALRVVASAMLSGILRGFSAAELGGRSGDLLPRIHRSWIRVIPFVTYSDVGQILEDLPAGPIHLGIQTSLAPFAQVVDSLLEDDPDHAPLPKLSDYSFQQRRIKVSLQPPPRATTPGRLEVQIYLSEDYVDKEALDGAYSDAATALLAPFAADLRAYVDHRDNLRSIAVPTIGLSNENNPAKQLRAILDSTFSMNDASAAQRPIDFNYAASFPLTDPKHAAYRHVERGSVRRLLQRFDRRNGVRLWCSVRRSGKTTSSASDLGSTSETAVVVTETCDYTGKHSGSNYVYTAIREALADGSPIRNDFFKKALYEALPDSREAERIVFVLDEYETLFGNLRSSVSNNSHSRYTVVQPLLDQMVDFADQNLIVFLGQQPDAHYMLMSQNQLSPYVEQDQFPLFTHDAEGYRGEFHELLQRVLTSYVDYDRSFANAVFDETGGHPFLTVNVLVALLDWLIEERQPRSLLQGGGMTDTLFAEFAAAKLTKREMLRQKPFEFFRKVARDALSPEGRSSDPWLYSIYAALRQASLDSTPDFEIPRNEFVDLITRLGIGLHDEPETVLSTACQSNFLYLEDDVVRPRIRVLSRIAATVSAE